MDDQLGRPDALNLGPFVGVDLIPGPANLTVDIVENVLLQRPMQVTPFGVLVHIL